MRSEEEKRSHSAYMREWRNKNREHVKEYARKFRAKNAEKYRELDRIKYARDPSKKRKASLEYKRKYPESQVAWQHGISRELVVSLRASECGICGKHGTKSKPLHIDHCHLSGKVRGALCGQCNSAIGFLKDDLGLVRAAVLYLERHA